MNQLSTMDVDEMRLAAAMWRALTRVYRPSESLSIYDRIDELIDEVERLRNKLRNAQERVES